VHSHQKSTLIGYVPQRLTEGSSSFPASVSEIIASGLNFNKYFWQPLSSFEKSAITETLKISQIEHLSNRLFAELSGGEKQRVLLARALVNNPMVLVLDEPTVGVDSKSQDKFYHLLKHLNQNHKMTIIFVSHDLAVVAKETSRILCLNQTLYEHDNPKDLLKEDFLTRLYGQNFKFINHNHNHA
jgi:zinc transport system ATP-binding protein